MKFPGQPVGGILESGGNVTIWAPWDPNSPNCSSKPFSVNADTTNVTGTGDTFSILGSNEGPTGYSDAVVVADEAGSVAAKAITAGFVRPNFPYKFIGIKFIPGSGTLTGNVTFYFNSAQQGVNIHP